MFRSISLISATLIFLTACASSPAPVRNGATSSGDFETVRPESGPIITENVERLYPNEKLFVCRGMTVSNQPRTQTDGEVTHYSRLIVVDGKVPLVTAPANNACISSGFGQRWGREHKGLDITSRPASRVFAAGSGMVIESGQNGGYGLSVLIDHGHNVFTRYAHLNYVEPNIRVGETVHYGEPLGLMGASGHVTGIHLHYEILTGSYQAGVWGRGLTPRNPFEFPAWVDPRLVASDTEAEPLTH